MENNKYSLSLNTNDFVSILVYIENGFDKNVFETKNSEEIQNIFGFTKDALEYFRLTLKYDGINKLKGMLDDMNEVNYEHNIQSLIISLNDKNFMDSISSIVILNKLRSYELSLPYIKNEYNQISKDNLLNYEINKFITNEFKNRLYKNTISLFDICRNMYDNIVYLYKDAINSYKELTVDDIKCIYYGTYKGDEKYDDLPYIENILYGENYNRVLGSLYNNIFSIAIENMVIDRDISNIDLEKNNNDDFNKEEITTNKNIKRNYINHGNRLNLSTLFLESICRQYAENINLKDSYLYKIQQYVAKEAIKNTVTDNLSESELNDLCTKYIELSKISKYPKSIKYILHSDLVQIPDITNRIKDEWKDQTNELIECVDDEYRMDEKLINIYASFYFLDLVSLRNNNEYIDYKYISDYIKYGYEFNKTYKYDLLNKIQSDLDKYMKSYISNYNDFYNYIEKLDDLDSINTVPELMSKHYDDLIKITHSCDAIVYVQYVMIYIILKVLKNK